MISFTSSWSSKFDPNMASFSQDVIKNETMLFSASIDDALRYGGAITHSFIKHLDKTKKWIIDSRVHMLMKGWYPCIPGWHNDDIPRGGQFNQPYWSGKNIKYRAEHVLCVVGNVSPTEFISPRQTFSLSDPRGKEALYGGWNREINSLIEKGELKTTKVGFGEIISFSEPDFHRGTMADSSGWRFFIRATTNTQREFADDPIRKQVQVYLKELEGGW